MNIFEKIELPNVKHIIAVASGKGGVGKSTVSANLAVALARQGLRVALVDADIYGPSIPTMFGIEDAKPEVTVKDEQEIIYPIERYGVKIISVGFFIAKDAGLIWRGPMVASFLTQLYENTQWGEIDYLIIDFPPGTGDIQLTTMQKLNLSGIIMVTTPQDIAVNDARKAASMFNNPELAIPILGVIENMSWFTPKSHPEEKYFIFGKGGGETLAKELNVKLLGQIPLVAEVGEAADKGLSIFNQSDGNVVTIFEKIVENIL
ncbi:MAG TPA: Mrp/NBP35 family ATP-binding protein [Bacteroidales bacterium]|jgi:ATP-binding protein involved in chromosome partitioning|nr:Mrp/NBP35 family ATP-binding protein [Bacteroidales bacterium]